MNRLLCALIVVVLYALPLTGSAQVLAGRIRVNGIELAQQRLTLSCPHFKPEAGWESTNLTWTLHLVEQKKVREKVPLDVHGRYSFDSNKWYEFDSSDENRLVILKGDFIYTRTYVADGITRGGRYVSKGEDVERPKFCTNMVTYIDRNTLEIKWEIDEDIPAPVVEGGQLKKCEHLDAWPLGKTMVSGQCQIVPYRAPPNRIGF